MSESSFGSPEFRAAVSLSPRLSTLKMRFRLSPPSDLSRFSISSSMGVEMRSKPDAR